MASSAWLAVAPCIDRSLPKFLEVDRMPAYCLYPEAGATGLELSTALALPVSFGFPVARLELLLLRRVAVHVHPCMISIGSSSVIVLRRQPLEPIIVGTVSVSHAVVTHTLAPDRL